jgi:hypothetical protein
VLTARGSVRAVVVYEKQNVIQARAVVSAELSVGTELFAIWGDIAMEQASQAGAARAQLAEALQAGQPPDLLNMELHTSMLAIVAAATSLDGFATVVKETGAAYPTLPTTAGRAEHVWETLKAGFDVAPKTNTWPRQLKELWKLRSARAAGGLLHPKTIFDRPTDVHPLVPGVSWARGTYRLETADEAISLMRDVYATCTESRLRPNAPDELRSRMNGLGATLQRLAG